MIICLIHSPKFALFCFHTTKLFLPFDILPLFVPTQTRFLFITIYPLFIFSDLKCILWAIVLTPRLLTAECPRQWRIGLPGYDTNELEKESLLSAVSICKPGSHKILLNFQKKGLWWKVDLLWLDSGWALYGFSHRMSYQVKQKCVCMCMYVHIFIYYIYVNICIWYTYIFICDIYVCLYIYISV